MTAPAGETAMVSTFTGPAVPTETEKYQKVISAPLPTTRPSSPRRLTMAGRAMVQYYCCRRGTQGKYPREFYMRKLEGSNIFQAG